MKSRPLVALSALASLIYLLTTDFGPAGWRVFLKVASITLLALLGFRVSKLLGTALTLGAVGDFLLDVPRLGSFGPEQLFLFGLGAFLVGHIVYIVMFRGYRSVSQSQRKDPLKQKKLEWGPSNLSVRTLAIFAVAAALLAVLGLLRNSLGPLLLPVVIYALVLATMAITAQFAEMGNSLAAIGALCFVASDAMLAVGKFHAPFPASVLLIWITYYLAQLLIFLGVSRRSQISA